MSAWKFRVTPNYVLRNIVHESILVPVSASLRHRDCLYVLNPVACAIYEELRAGTNVSDLPQRLQNRFDCDHSTNLSADIDEFISQLIEIEAILHVTS